MHVHISRHRNHGYVPADDCLCFALIYLCMMVCMWLLCVCGVCFCFFGNLFVYLGKTLMTSSYFSYDLSLRYSWVYCSSAHGKSSVYLGKLSEQVRIWLLTFLDGTCIQMSSISFDNATLDYILVIWVCTVR